MYKLTIHRTIVLCFQTHQKFTQIVVPNLLNVEISKIELQVLVFIYYKYNIIYFIFYFFPIIIK